MRTRNAIMLENNAIRSTRDVEKIRCHNARLRGERDRYARENMLLGHKIKIEKHYSDADANTIIERKRIYEYIEKLIKENEELIKEIQSSWKVLGSTVPRQLKLWSEEHV